MPHVYHYDSTSGSGDAHGTSHRQARGRRLLHASRQQGRTSAPSGTATTKPQVTVRTSVVTVLERSYRLIPTVLGQQPVDPLMVATVLTVTGRSSLTAILAVEAATAGAPTMGLTGELGAVATAAAEATRTVTSPAPHVAASTPARKSKNYCARRPPRQATMTASLPSLCDFATYSSQRNLSLWELPSTTRSKI
jgi:hypothetical protein